MVSLTLDSTRDCNELDAANIRREFRAAIKAAGIE
jgi:hypothetical protein